MGWRVGRVKQMTFESSFEGVQVPELRMEAGILFLVAGAETMKKCQWMHIETNQN